MARTTSKIDRAELYKSITGRGESGTGVPTVESEPARAVPSDREETTYKTYKITQKQYQAILMKKATSKDPKYADTSAVVRAALDAFLSDIIEGL